MQVEVQVDRVCVEVCLWAGGCEGLHRAMGRIIEIYFGRC